MQKALSFFSGVHMTRGLVVTTAGRQFHWTYCNQNIAFIKQLTPCSTVLLQKLTVPQSVTFPALYTPAASVPGKPYE
jgi:hypothetical protein